MYRNCCKCNCKHNWNNCNNSVESDYEDCLEDSCSDVENTLGLYDDCGCGYDEYNDVFPENPTLAQSYVPVQTMGRTFIPCVGLKMGTIYPELVSPYMPGQSMAEIEYLKARNEIKEGCNKC